MPVASTTAVDATHVSARVARLGAFVAGVETEASDDGGFGCGPAPTAPGPK